MGIINFEDAKVQRQSKTRNRSKQMVTKHLPEIDSGVSELQRQYRELAQFYNQWYDEHIMGQDENGGWIYKDL